MERKVGNELFSPSTKIISVSPEGYLQLNEENSWVTVMDCIKEFSFEMELPVAVVSIIGSQSSTRSLLNNLVLEEFPKSIWRGEKSSKQMDMNNFDESSKESNGIYLWPRPLLSYRQGDMPLLIWLLYLNYQCLDEESDHGLRTLETFLMLGSSRIAEIDVDNNDFRALRHHSKILRAPIQAEICDSIVYISVAKWNAHNCISIDDETKQKLLEMLEASNKNTEIDSSIVNQFSHVTVIRLKNVDSETHEVEGYIGQTNCFNIETSLQVAVGFIKNASTLAPKKMVDDGKPLTMKDFVHSLKTWTETANTLVDALSDPSSTTIPAEGEDDKREANDSNKDDWVRCNSEVDDKFQREKQHNLELLMVNTAARAKFVMCDSIREWIFRNLSPANVTELMGIYDEISETVVSKAHAAVDETLWNELDRIIAEDCRDRYTLILEVVAERLQSFCHIMMKRFDFFEYFTTPDLEKIGAEEHENISKTIEADKFETFQLVKAGCETLMKYFRRGNDKIIKSEELLADELIPEVVKFYNEEMKGFLLAGVYHPNKLKEAHAALLNRLVISFKTAFKFSNRGTVCEAVENKSKVLRTTLDKGFSLHLNRNLESLKKKQAEINKIQTHFKLAIAEELDSALKQDSDNRPIEDWRMDWVKHKHDEVITTIKEQFEFEIKHRIRPDEPTQDHWNSVQQHIDTIWKCKVEENQRAKEEDETKIRLARISKFRVGGNSSKNCGKELPPLVFHLQCEVIRMGLCGQKGRPQMLRNDLGENSTPFVVGFSETKDFLYGREVLAHIPPKGTWSSTSHLKKLWWVSAQLSLSETDTCQEFISLRDGSQVKISAELLLAFILKKMRSQAEREMVGEFSTTVIAIPFWFGSSQRVQVKNSGYLAGFTEVFLVNEASACAWLVRGVPICPVKILVLSENSGTIDATLYAYFPDSTEMKMIAHYGKYRGKKIKLSKRYKVNKPIRNYGTMAAKEQERLKIFEKVCEKALERAKDYRGVDKPSVPDKVVAVSESDVWAPVLKAIGERYESRFCPMLEEAAILGTALLSRDPSKIKDNLRENLAFDIVAGMTRVLRSAPVFKIQDPLPSNYIWSATATFPEARKDSEGLHFFQNVLGKKESLGSLKGITQLPVDSRVFLGVDVSSEAIFTIVELSYSPSTIPSDFPLGLSKFWSPTKVILQPKSEEGARLQSILESIMRRYNEDYEPSSTSLSLSDTWLVVENPVTPMEISEADEKMSVEDPEEHAHPGKQTQVGEEMQINSSNVEYEMMPF